MATSGAFAFAPSLADLMIQAFGRCQIRRAALTPEHLFDAATCANLVQAEFSNRQVNLWTVDLQSQALTQGTATYNAPASTVSILSAYIETGSPATGRVITSIGRDTYAAYPNKASEGPPNVYWFDRQRTPIITLWPVPDDGGPYTLKYYRAVQQEDAEVADGVEPDVPYRFLEAYTAALAAKLAEIYAPTREAVLEQRAAARWAEAAAEDAEDVPMFIAPAVGAYFTGT